MGRRNRGGRLPEVKKAGNARLPVLRIDCKHRDQCRGFLTDANGGMNVLKTTKHALEAKKT